MQTQTKKHRGIEIHQKFNGTWYADIRLGPGGKKERLTGLNFQQVADQIDKIARTLGR